MVEIKNEEYDEYKKSLYIYEEDKVRKSLKAKNRNNTHAGHVISMFNHTYVTISDDLIDKMVTKDSFNKAPPLIDSSLQYDDIKFRSVLLDERYILDKDMYAYSLSRRKVRISFDTASNGVLRAVITTTKCKCGSNQTKFLEGLIICDDCKEVVDTIDRIE